MKDTGLARGMIPEVCLFVFLILVVWWVGACVCVCVCVCLGLVVLVFLGVCLVFGVSECVWFSWVCRVLCFLVWVCAWFRDCVS